MSMFVLVIPCKVYQFCLNGMSRCYYHQSVSVDSCHEEFVPTFPLLVTLIILFSCFPFAYMDMLSNKIDKMK